MNQIDSTRSVSLAPKRRCKFDTALRLRVTARPTRIKKSGRPHEQIWLRPSAADCAGRLKLRAAATLDEMMCQVTRASLSPPHYSFLQRPNRFDFGKTFVKLRDLVDRCRSCFALPMKRVAAAFITLLTLAHAWHHRPESFW